MIMFVSELPEEGWFSMALPSAGFIFQLKSAPQYELNIFEVALNLNQEF